MTSVFKWNLNIFFIGGRYIDRFNEWYKLRSEARTIRLDSLDFPGVGTKYVTCSVSEGVNKQSFTDTLHSSPQLYLRSGRMIAEFYPVPLKRVVV